MAHHDTGTDQLKARATRYHQEAVRAFAERREPKFNNQ